MDSKKLESILRKGLDKAKAGIQSNLVSSGRNASGDTSKSLRVVSEITANYVKVSLLGSKVLGALEFGRSPTKNRSPKGKSVWFDSLLKWVRLRGLPDGAVYPIFKKINKEGYKGTKGLVTDPVNEFTEHNSCKAIKN